MTLDQIPAKKRYELSCFVGPCSEEQCEALMVAIIELPEFAIVYGGAVGVKEAEIGAFDDE